VFSVRSVYRMLVTNRERTAACEMVDRGSRTSNQKKKNGLLYGRFKYLPRSKCSCGDWLGFRFLLGMCYITGLWK
jgi:hypothetical protein